MRKRDLLRHNVDTQIHM